MALSSAICSGPVSYTHLQLGQRLSEGCLDVSELLAGGAVQEDAAALDEAALEEFLEAGELSVATLSRMVAERKLFQMCIRDSREGARHLRYLLGAAVHL